MVKKQSKKSSKQVVGYEPDKVIFMTVTVAVLALVLIGVAVKL